jgi:hypothetical protein
MSEARKISLAIVERKQLMFKNRYPGCFSIKIYFHKRKEEKTHPNNNNNNNNSDWGSRLYLFVSNGSQNDFLTGYKKKIKNKPRGPTVYT